MKKSNSIDTLRLRALHTACMTVDEIADKMSITVEDTEYELKKMGYTPIYKHDMPERYGFKKKEENNMPRGEKTPVEKVHEISVLRDEGKSQREIAEITGVPQTTVCRVCSKLGKTKEEPAPSANDTSSKGVNEKNIFTNNIIPEIPANVNPCDEVSDENFCCEVTGGTNMEAYLADRKRISTRETIPEAVVEACREKRAELQDKINIARSDIKDWSRELREITEFLGANCGEVGQ